MMASQGPFAASQNDYTQSSSLLGRRRLLGLGLVAAASSLVPATSWASQGPAGDRALSFYNTHDIPNVSGFAFSVIHTHAIKSFEQGLRLRD
jgi:hypothetical protein